MLYGQCVIAKGALDLLVARKLPTVEKVFEESVLKTEHCAEFEEMNTLAATIRRLQGETQPNNHRDPRDLNGEQVVECTACRQVNLVHSRICCCLRSSYVVSSDDEHLPQIALALLDRDRS